MRKKKKYCQTKNKTNNYGNKRILNEVSSNGCKTIKKGKTEWNEEIHIIFVVILRIFFTAKHT